MHVYLYLTFLCIFYLFRRSSAAVFSPPFTSLKRAGFNLAYNKQFRNVAFNSSRRCLRSGISWAFGPTACIIYFIGLGKFPHEVWVTWAVGNISYAPLDWRLIAEVSRLMLIGQVLVTTFIDSGRCADTQWTTGRGQWRTRDRLMTAGNLCWVIIIGRWPARRPAYGCSRSPRATDRPANWACSERRHRLIGPIPWGHSGPLPLSRVVVVVVVVDIDAQAARDSIASDICWMGVRRLAVVNGPSPAFFKCFLLKTSFRSLTT